MKKWSMLLGVVAWVMVAASAASAQQIIPPGGSQFNPLPPPPPPPPKIEVPVVPQMDEPPRQPTVRSGSRRSFGDRISDCLDEAAAAGVRPSRRAAYSRACANR